MQIAKTATGASTLSTVVTVRLVLRVSVSGEVGLDNIPIDWVARKVDTGYGVNDPAKLQYPVLPSLRFHPLGPVQSPFVVSLSNYERTALRQARDERMG